MITKEDIINSSKNLDFGDQILLLRLYYNYINQEKDNYEDKLGYSDSSIIKLKTAFDGITKVISYDDLENYNYKMFKYINEKYKILASYINSYDMNNYKKEFNNKLPEMKRLITELETVLGLNITYPKAVEDCILRKLEKGKKYTYGK